MPTKPAMSDISHGLQSWDTTINDNFGIAGKLGNPVPLPQFANVAALPAANMFLECFALVYDGTVGLVPYYSDGTNWIPMGKRAAHQAHSSAALLATLVTDFNNLLDALQAAGLMA